MYFISEYKKLYLPKNVLTRSKVIKLKSKSYTLSFIFKIFRKTFPKTWKDDRFTPLTFRRINEYYHLLIMEDLVKESGTFNMGCNLGLVFIKGLKMKANSKYLFKDFNKYMYKDINSFRANYHSDGLLYKLKWDKGNVANVRFFYLKPLGRMRKMIYDSVHDDTINTY